MSTEPQSPTFRRGRMSPAEVVTIVLLFLVVAGVMVGLILGSARERSRRSMCAANLKGLGTGFHTYEPIANDDEWPVPAHAKAVAPGQSRVTYASGKIGSRRGSAEDPKAGETTTEDTEMSTTRVLWFHVRHNVSSRRSLICPSTADHPNQDAHPERYWDFRDWHEVSYGVQVPFGMTGRLRKDADARMAFMADKGPFGAALEAGNSHPGIPSAATTAHPADWRPWNSPNHRGQGQVVLYADAHAQYESKPIVGVANDNIYTRWSNAAGDDDARIHGTPPTGTEAPFSDTDSLIYP